MTNEVYRSWLTDRGIDSPGSQPFELKGSHLHLASRVLIVAESAGPDFAETSSAIEKLSSALSSPEQPVSWFLIMPNGAPPDEKLLKSLLPRLSKIISLADRSLTSDGGFSIEVKTVAGTSLQRFLGPAMNQMTIDLELKRRFWNDVRTWLSS